MLYKVILLFCINVLFVKIVGAVEYKTKSYLNQDYDLLKSLYSNNYIFFYKNNSILNLAPKLNISGFTYIQYNINGVTSNFLNLPLNHVSVVSPALFEIGNNKRTFLSNCSLNNVILYIYNIPRTSIKDNPNLSVKFSNNIFSQVFTIDENLMGYYKSDNFSLLLAVNYLHGNHSDKVYNFGSNDIPVNRYNNLISFQYTPKDKNVSLKVTNLSFYYDSKKNITKNKLANLYFDSNILKYTAFGNYFLVSYEPLFNSETSENYYSHIAISSSWININNQHNLIKYPNIYYENIDYKVQYTTNFNDVLYNNLLLIYGIKLDRNVTKTNTVDKKFFWPKGVDSSYKIFLDSSINILNANILYINPSVRLKYSINKSSEHNSYRLKNVEPIFNIVLNLTKNFNLYGKYSYNKRLPYIYEKYINGYYFYNSYFIKFSPNYNLSKQTNSHWYYGLNTKFSFINKINLETSLSAFYYKNKNHIDYMFIDKFNIMFTNLNYAILSGYSAAIYISLTSLDTKIIYNTIKGKDSNNNYLNSLYPNNIVIDSSFEIPVVKLKVGMKAKLFDKFSKYSNKYPFKKISLPGYSLFDIYFDYKSNKDHLSLIIGVENIFNKKYQVPYILEAYKDRRYFCNFTFQL